MPEVSPILNIYRRAGVQMQRGEGCYLYDSNGRQYLDFAAGIAVNALGHCHPHLVATMKQQVETLWHCSNLFTHAGLEHFSARLVQASGMASVFCCNSGAEAAEAAIKFVRRYHDKTGNPDRYRIIVAEGAFHGRTLAALSACTNPKATDTYAPLVDCFDVVPFNVLEALEAAITPETGAIMLEPIQGEGGIRPHSTEYLQKARELCDAYGLLLVFDEVQCGMARSGELFAFEQACPHPDLLLIGKGIGNGFPLAACLVNEAVAAVMEPGCHGSTFGSNPLAMAAGNAVLDVMLEADFLPHLNRMAAILQSELTRLHTQYPQHLGAWRGRGLLLGIPVTASAYALTAQLREQGLIVAPAGDGVIRILPPLIVQESHIAEAVEKLERTISA